MPTSPRSRPSFWARLLRALGLRASPDKQRFELDRDISQALHGMAHREQRSPDDFTADLLDDAIRQRRAAIDVVARWQSLSPREKQVAALVCLGYSYNQIAVRLSVTPSTVKTHAQHLLRKFDVQSKHALRMLLEDWDFSDWD